jgi:hypothetical protein
MQPGYCGALLHYECKFYIALRLADGLIATFLTFFRRSGTSNNLNQFAGNDGLTCSVEQDLIAVDHFTSIF